MPLRMPVIATVPNGPGLKVFAGAAVESGAVIEGFGSGVGVVGAAAAGACPDESAAGACGCAKAGELNTAISTNVRRPPHCFFTIKLLSELLRFLSEHRRSGREFTRRLKERPTQFFD